MGVKLNVQDFIKDYRQGIKDKDLLAKHTLNAKELIAVVRKLINEGLISKEDYFDRNRRIQELEVQEEKAFLQSLAHCPVCGHIHPTPFTVCPACGTDVTKLKETENVPEPSSVELEEPDPESEVPPTFTPPPLRPLAPCAGPVGVQFGKGLPETVEPPASVMNKLDAKLDDLRLLPDMPEDFLNGDYVLTEVMSHSDTSTLFRAEDLSGLRPALGVKLYSQDLLAPELFDEFIERLIGYQSGMNEFNIARLMGEGGLEGERVLVYEAMPSNLEKVMKKSPEGLSFDLLMTILPQILNALGYSHMHRSKDGEVRRIAHFHLSLSRLLFDEKSYYLKLDDCGLRKALVDVRGHKKKIWEEPDIDVSALAPEGFVQDCRFVNGYFADIYALGVVLYRLATGMSPFYASTVEEYHFAHLRTFPIPPRVHRYTLPAWFDSMVMKCLEKEPARRWRSATQMELSIGKSFQD